MNHLLTFLLAVGLCTALTAQNITQVEYFLDDNDRGPGKNTLVAVTPGTDVTTALTVPLAGLAPGFHRLCVRAKDADNQWSTTLCRTFFVTDRISGGDNLVATEYFIDTDAGLGKNTRIALPAADRRDTVQAFNVNLSNVPVGFHTLYLRSQNRNGDWGPTIARTFFVDNKKRPARITRLDYYYVNTGTAAASPLYAYQIARPGPRVDTTFMADAQTLVVGQPYRLYVYATNENGERSLLNSTSFTFKACENVPVPTVSIKSGTPGISAALVLTASVPGSPAGVTYQWLLNGNPIDGATAQDYPVAAADFGAGGAVYAVRIALASGCRATSQNLTVTALEKAPAGGGLLVYPNPARDRITVAFTPTGPAKAVRSTVHDVLGREMGGQELQRQADGSWQTIVSTAGYGPGTYLLRVETGTKTIFRSFVKQ